MRTLALTVFLAAGLTGCNTTLAPEEVQVMDALMFIMHGMEDGATLRGNPVTRTIKGPVAIYSHNKVSYEMSVPKKCKFHTKLTDAGESGQEVKEFDFDLN